MGGQHAVSTRRLVTGAWLAALLCPILLATAGCGRGTHPPLSDREFWTLIETLSEPPGTFSLSDNFVSNEPRLAENVRWLRPAGGVYIGVGPEQNFSYIARVRPHLAFVIDIRSDNRNLHLLYKALFELSLDRVDFVSHLFSRPRPADLPSTAAVEEIFARFEQVPPSPEQFRLDLTRVREHLTTARRLPIGEADFEAIARAFKAFYTDGPKLQFWGSRAVDDDAVRPSYRELMTAKDWMGHSRSFLASEEAFAFVKHLHSQNLIVPLVGDFGGPSTLRRVGDYLRTRGEVVRAFYGSNVGVYLNNRQTLAFCRNLASLPAAPDAWFIESSGVRSFAAKREACAPGTQ